MFKSNCEKKFSFFAKHMLKVLEPETSFEWNWHHDVLCDAFQDVVEGKYSKLDINISPRTLKSLLINILGPCWIWTTHPSYKIISASSSHALASKFNIKRREVIESDAYRSLWAIKIKDYSNTIQKFENVHNGFMSAFSAGGSITGEGADLLLSDDVLDVKDAFSKIERESKRNWFSTAFYNRAQNKKTVKRININQRLHDADISDLLKELGYERLIIPMVKTEHNDSTIPFNDPRQVGELMHPSRYGEKEAEDDKKMGSYVWSSQYQQSPVPVGGGIIKDEQIRYYDTLPVDEHGKPLIRRKIITADLKFKGAETDDYVCFQCWGIDNIGRRYLIDIVRGKWSYKVTKDNFKIFCDKNQCDRKWIEDKANGPALISDYEDTITGMKAWPENGSPYKSASKIQRLHMVSKHYENGVVYFPKAENISLITNFVAELVSFTEKGSTTGNDDMVDTSTMALIELDVSETFAAS